MQYKPRTYNECPHIVLMWIGLACLVVGSYMMSPTVGLPISIGGLGAYYFGLLSSVKLTTSHLTSQGKYMVWSLFVWHFYMFVISDIEDITNLAIWTEPYFFSLYLFPLILMVEVRPLVTSFFRFTHVCIYLAPIALAMILIFHYDNSIKQIIFETFAFCAGFVLLTYRYHSRRHIGWAIATLVMGLLVSTIMARRNLMLTCGMYLAAAAIVWYVRESSGQNKLFLILGSIVGVICVVGIIAWGANSMFAQIAQRANANTRDFVFLFYFLDLLQSPLDILIGRGIRGTYECPAFDGSNSTNRHFIENGILHIILKGGVIYLCIYLTTFIYAIRRAFRSANMMCLAAGIILVIQLVDMLPFGLHGLNVKTMMIWMCVALLLQHDVWQLSDDEVEEQFFEPTLKLPDWK